MGQRSFDETIELERTLEPLLRNRTIQEAKLEAWFGAERARIASEIGEALDASLAARGYRRASGAGAEGVWVVDNAEGGALEDVIVSLPSDSDATLKVRVGARDDVTFTVDHPSFAALTTDERDPATLSAQPSPGDLRNAFEPFRSPQELDHQRYHARVARMKEDIAAARQAITELALAISTFEVGQPHRFMSESGDSLDSIESLLHGVFEA